MLLSFLREGHVEFSHPTYSGSETSGSIVVTLLLRGSVTSKKLTVTVELFDNTASSSGGRRKRCATLSCNN